MEGPPEDFNLRSTEHGDIGPAGYPLGPRPPAAQSPQEPAEWGDLPTTHISFQSDDPEVEPTPWYRKPVNLIAWAAAVLILIGLIIYGIIQLIGEDKGPGNAPSSTTATTTSTVPPTATTSAPPSSSTSTSEPPSTSTAVEPPPQPTNQPTHQPTRPPPTHHHLPPLPSVITIPDGPTITVPPDLTR